VKKSVAPLIQDLWRRFFFVSIEIAEVLWMLILHPISENGSAIYFHIPEQNFIEKF
jgi:hypothetical protein